MRWLGGSRVVVGVVFGPGRTRVARFRFSSLALFRNVQPSLLCKFSQPLLGTSGAEQRDALRSEPLLGDRHELLERFIAGLAKELDRSRGLSEPYASWQVVNDAAATRSRVARGEGAKVVVVALDCRSSQLPSEPPQSPLVSSGGPRGQELLPGARPRFDTCPPPSVDLHSKLSLRGLPLESEQLVELAFVRPRNGHGGNRMMPQLEMPPVCRSGRIDLRGQRLALRLTPSPCGTKGIPILEPEPIVPRSP